MNKVCWITGGGSGIGAELAKKLSQKNILSLLVGEQSPISLKLLKITD